MSDRRSTSTKLHVRIQRGRLAHWCARLKAEKLSDGKSRTLEDISKIVGVSTSTVCKLLKRAERDYQLWALYDTAEWITEAIGELQHLRREAADAWERSKHPKSKIKISEDGKGGGNLEETEEGQVGDPRFLDLHGKYLMDEAKLRGALRDDINLTQQIAVAGDAQIVNADPLLILRQEPEYLEYLHHRAIERDAITGPVGEGGQPGPVADGQAPGVHRPGANGHAGGNGHAKPNGLPPAPPRQE